MEKYLKYTYINNELNLYVPEDAKDLFNNYPTRFNLIYVREKEKEKELSNNDLRKEIKELKKLILNMNH